MPELPEVETVVRSVRPHLVGRTIVSAEFRSRFVTPGDRDELSRELTGRRILAVERRAKFIVVTLDRGTMLIHLGMTGKLLIGAPRGVHAYGILELDRGTLVYDDPRQFGRIEYHPELPPRVARLGPEPLSLEFPVFFQALRERRSRIKPLLLNQGFLGGMGNIYADEALFRAGIHPRAMASRLSAERARRLHAAIQRILAEAIEHRGSSISDYVDAEGERGSFQSLHNVYGRAGEPCRICGNPIRRIVMGQRGTHYCPKCQRV